MKTNRRSARLREAREGAGALPAMEEVEGHGVDRRTSIGATLGVTPKKKTGINLTKAKAVDAAVAAAHRLDDMNVTVRRKQRSSKKARQAATRKRNLAEPGRAAAASEYEPKSRESMVLLQKTTELFDVDEKCDGDAGGADMPNLHSPEHDDEEHHAQLHYVGTTVLFII